MAKSEKQLTIFDKMVQSATGAGKILGNPADPAREMYPELWRWLTVTEAGEEHIKDPARLSLRAAPGGWLVSLSDDAFGVSLDAASPFLADALQAIEAVLQAPSPALRTWSRTTEVKLRKKAKKGDGQS